MLGRPWGNRGELTAISLSDKPDRFARLKRVRLGDTEYVVERVREHQGSPVFKFEGIDSINDAEPLRWLEVCIPISERVELEPGEYFHSDLVGCELKDRATGRSIGKVTAIQEYGGPTLLDVDNGRLLVPFVKAICPIVRIADRVIEADLPEGLETL